MENQPPPPAKQLDDDGIDLPAPEGWTKKFFPQKAGTPRRWDVEFTSPTNEKIKTRKQLEQYIKKHENCPPISEFDWSTGDTPRRSSRLNVKSKAVESAGNEAPKKKQRKSSKKAVKVKKDDSDGEERTEEKEVASEDTKGSASVVMEDGDHNKTEIVTEAATSDKDDVKDMERNTDEGRGVETFADDDTTKITEKGSDDKVDDATMDKAENLENTERTSDTKEEGCESESMQTPVIKGNDQPAGRGTDLKDSSQQPPLPSEAAAYTDQGAESVNEVVAKEAVTEVADAQVETMKNIGPTTKSSEVKTVTDAVHAVAENAKAEKSKNLEVGQREDHQKKETPDISVSCI